MTSFRQTEPNAFDRALDLAIIPGYSRLGYALRGLSWRTAVAGDLRGKTALVTGGSSGIGEATCEGLLAAGAQVHLLGRDTRRVAEAVARLTSRSAGSGELHPEECDLSDLADVRRFAESFMARRQRLDVLVHNAGVLPESRQQTGDGLELAFATNVVGPFLLTSLLLPALAAAAPSRVITVSSGGMYTARLRAGDLQLAGEPYQGSRAYAHTKRIEVVLNGLWWQHHAAEGIAFHSMHPGWVATAGLRRSLPGFARATRPILRSPRQGADTIVWLATSPAAQSCGGCFWHDRAPRPEHRLPATRESATDRQRLWEECERLTALRPRARKTTAAA